MHSLKIYIDFSVSHKTLQGGEGLCKCMQISWDTKEVSINKLICISRFVWKSFDTILDGGLSLS